MLYDEIKRLSEGGDYQLVMKEEETAERIPTENAVPAEAKA